MVRLVAVSIVASFLAAQIFAAVTAQQPSPPNWCCMFPTTNGGNRCVPKQCAGSCYFVEIRWSTKDSEIRSNTARTQTNIGGCWDVQNNVGDEPMQKYLKFGGTAEQIFGYLTATAQKQDIFVQANKNNALLTKTADEAGLTAYLTNRDNLVQDLLQGKDPITSGAINMCNMTRLKSHIVKHELYADLPLFVPQTGKVLYNSARVKFCDARNLGRNPSQSNPTNCQFQDCNAQSARLQSIASANNAAQQQNSAAAAHAKLFDICSETRVGLKFPDVDHTRLIDAMVETEDGNKYAFAGQYYWKLGGLGVPPEAGYPKLISQDWPSLPAGLNTAVTWMKHTYFFKGDKHWRLTNNNLQPAYPMDNAVGFKDVTNIDKKPVTAAFSTDLEAGTASLYLFQDIKFWQLKYDQATKQPKATKPEDDFIFSDPFFGDKVPPQIDAAFYSQKDKKAYVFLDDKFSVVNVGQTSLEVEQEALNTRQKWFGCP